MNPVRAICACAVLVFYLTDISATFAQSPSGFDACKIISDDRLRLDCLKGLLPKTPEPAPSAGDAWQLIRTPNPKGGREAIAITRTADVTRSDPDFAGLLIRCKEGAGTEVVLAVLRPFAPLSKRSVILRSGGHPSTIQAQATQNGTGLVLSMETEAFMTGRWRNLEQLDVSIDHPEGEIKGIVPLSGFAPALARLLPNCS